MKPLRYSEITSTITSKFKYSPITSTTEFWIQKISEPEPLRKSKNEKRNLEIRERYANGETQRAIAKDYGIPQQCISIICQGVERRAGRIVKNKNVKRLNKEEYKKRNDEIKEKFANGEKQKTLASEYRLPSSSICKICKGVERKNVPKDGSKKNIDS